MPWRRKLEGRYNLVQVWKHKGRPERKGRWSKVLDRQRVERELKKKKKWENRGQEGEGKYLFIFPSSPKGMLISIKRSALLVSLLMCLCVCVCVCVYVCARSGVKRSDMVFWPFGALSEVLQATAHRGPSQSLSQVSLQHKHSLPQNSDEQIHQFWQHYHDNEALCGDFIFNSSNSQQWDIYWLCFSKCFFHIIWIGYYLLVFHFLCQRVAIYFKAWIYYFECKLSTLTLCISQGEFCLVDRHRGLQITKQPKKHVMRGSDLKSIVVYILIKRSVIFQGSKDPQREREVLSSIDKCMIDFSPLNCTNWHELHCTLTQLFSHLNFNFTAYVM